MSNVVLSSVRLKTGFGTNSLFAFAISYVLAKAVNYNLQGRESCVSEHAHGDMNKMEGD